MRFAALNNDYAKPTKTEFESACCVTRSEIPSESDAMTMMPVPNDDGAWTFQMPTTKEKVKGIKEWQLITSDAGDSTFLKQTSHACASKGSGYRKDSLGVRCSKCVDDNACNDVSKYTDGTSRAKAGGCAQVTEPSANTGICKAAWNNEKMCMTTDDVASTRPVYDGSTKVTAIPATDNHVQPCMTDFINDPDQFNDVHVFTLLVGGDVAVPVYRGQVENSGGTSTAPLKIRLPTHAECVEPDNADIFTSSYSVKDTGTPKRWDLPSRVLYDRWCSEVAKAAAVAIPSVRLVVNDEVIGYTRVIEATGKNIGSMAITTTALGGDSTLLGITPFVFKQQGKGFTLHSNDVEPDTMVRALVTTTPSAKKRYTPNLSKLRNALKVQTGLAGTEKMRLLPHETTDTKRNAFCKYPAMVRECSTTAGWYDCFEKMYKYTTHFDGWLDQTASPQGPEFLKAEAVYKTDCQPELSVALTVARDKGATPLNEPEWVRHVKVYAGYASPKCRLAVQRMFLTLGVTGTDASRCVESEEDDAELDACSGMVDCGSSPARARESLDSPSETTRLFNKPAAFRPETASHDRTPEKVHTALTKTLKSYAELEQTCCFAGPTNTRTCKAGQKKRTTGPADLIGGGQGKLADLVMLWIDALDSTGDACTGAGGACPSHKDINQKLAWDKKTEAYYTMVGVTTNSLITTPLTVDQVKNVIGGAAIQIGALSEPEATIFGAPTFDEILTEDAAEVGSCMHYARCSDPKVSEMACVGPTASDYATATFEYSPAYLPRFKDAATDPRYLWHKAAFERTCCKPVVEEGKKSGAAWPVVVGALAPLPFFLAGLV